MPAAEPSTGPDVRYCDLILKGGLTSGVVYPSAVCQLAKDFHFKNIGGTSAGAIIAAATAAAELGGRGQPNVGFERLKQMPCWFGEGTHHFDLFQPQRSTRGLFEVAFAMVGHEHGLRRTLRLAGKSLQYFWPWALAGLVPSLLLLWVVGMPADWKRLIAGWLLVGLLGLAGIVTGVAGGFLVRATRLIPANQFGLARGYDPAEDPDRPGITSWLDHELDQLAGRAGAEAPLTFGDLWGRGKEADPVRQEAGLLPKSDDRRINLEMMTTCLTLGRPYRLPLAVERTQRTFYFDPVEFGLYFPQRVVQHCIRHAHGDETTSADGRTIYPLPRPRDMPIVVAVRMSLSFPLLFSAVPLYTEDLGRPEKNGRPPDRCWFSDGGIGSNLPVHFFDGPIPRWPTFAVNLRPFTAAHPRSRNEADNVWMPRYVKEGGTEWWTQLEVDQVTEKRCSGRRQLVNLFRAIFDTAQNWRDNIQLQVPGYRDRVVHVQVDDRAEGGLNLRMDPEVLRRLAQRGAAAGDLVRRRYVTPSTAPQAVNWLSHRWTRYRTAMQVEQQRLARMLEAYEYCDPHTPLLRDLIGRDKGVLPDVYEWNEAQRRAEPLKATESLLKIEKDWQDRQLAFEPDAPLPYPELRVTPQL